MELIGQFREIPPLSMAACWLVGVLLFIVGPTLLVVWLATRNR